MKRIALLVITILCFSCSEEEKPFEEDSGPVDTDFFSDKEVEVYFENDSNSGINVVFLGDGYLKKDLGKEFGNYRRDAREMLDELFNTHPFSEYIDFFNVYIVYAESLETGEDLGHIMANNITTAFQINRTSNDISYDFEKAFDFATSALPVNNDDVNLILMATNYGMNGLATGMIAFVERMKIRTMKHEVGHAFGQLGDEYNNNFTNPEIYPNLDSTNDIGVIEWSHFIGLENYENVGAFERTQGWVPESFSLMGNNEIGNSFNAPSREAIVKKIMELRGLDYNFSDFLEIDEISLEKINSQ